MHDTVIRGARIVNGSGEATYEQGDSTGTMPGRLLRGSQAA